MKTALGRVRRVRDEEEQALYRGDRITRKKGRTTISIFLIFIFIKLSPWPSIPLARKSSAVMTNVFVFLILILQVFPTLRYRYRRVRDDTFCDSRQG